MPRRLQEEAYFHAALVSIELRAADDSTLDIPGNGSASYYAGGWHAVTTPDPANPSVVEAEMLPGSVLPAELSARP